jgi:very-short-patch-repair endonuclease
MPKSRLRDHARDLRAGSTRAERRLWRKLQGRRLGGWKWKRQVPRGPYIVDFLCADARLVVELDGGGHSERIDYDERRTEWLAAQGLTVARFWNHEVIEDLTAVCDAILARCGGTAPHPPSPDGLGPSLSPFRGEGFAPSPRASGEREGPAPEAWEGEGPQARSTKLSMTFFSPALSKATVSLLPSTAVIFP